jgi:hypothetical protein
VVGVRVRVHVCMCGEPGAVWCGVVWYLTLQTVVVAVQITCLFSVMDGSVPRLEARPRRCDVRLPHVGKHHAILDDPHTNLEQEGGKQPASASGGGDEADSGMSRKRKLSGENERTNPTPGGKMSTALIAPCLRNLQSRCTPSCH